MANKNLAERKQRTARINARIQKRKAMWANPETLDVDDFVWLGDEIAPETLEGTVDPEAVFRAEVDPDALLETVLLSIAKALPNAHQEPLPHVRVARAMKELRNTAAPRGPKQTPENRGILLDIARRCLAIDLGFGDEISMSQIVRAVLTAHDEKDPTDDRIRALTDSFNNDRDRYLAISSQQAAIQAEVAQKVSKAIDAIEALGIPVKRATLGSKRGNNPVSFA